MNEDFVERRIWLANQVFSMEDFDEELIASQLEGKFGTAQIDTHLTLREFLDELVSDGLLGYHGGRYSVPAMERLVATC